MKAESHSCCGYCPTILDFNAVLLGNDESSEASFVYRLLIYVVRVSTA